MRILGIDPGSENTGYGIIESDGSCHSSVAWGTVRTQSRRPFQTRLLKIYAELCRISATVRLRLSVSTWR